MQGRLDSPLTEEGRAQADEHGQVLNSIGEISGIWSSSAGRARETTELINQHLRQKVVYSDELVERDCGFWSGKTVDEISDALERDNFMTAEEAKKFGLIDSVVEKRK